MSNKIEGADTSIKKADISKPPKLDDYDVIPQQAVAASKIITTMWKDLGKPVTPLSESGQKLMKIIIAVWEDLYPLQREQWYAERKEYQKEEKSIKDQVKDKTGRSLASYPYPIYSMMKKVFPKFDAGERKNCMKLVKKFPMFRMANRI